MTRRKFDRFMLANSNGRNLKLARFTDAQFRAFIQGVLPIASEATPRGAFMVGNQPATAADIVFMAPSVSLRTARSTVDLLHKLGMLDFDEQLGGEWVHDFDVFNPAPKSDPTNAERQARWRERNASSNGAVTAVTGATVTALVTPPEVEGEVEDPPSPPGGNPSVTPSLSDLPPVRPSGNRKSEHDEWRTEFGGWAETHFPGCPVSALMDLVARVVALRVEPTPATVRSVALSEPNFAHLLESAA